MAASCCVWVEDFTFEGVMIHSNVVRRAGPPRADFFITFDDYEYALRLRYGLREKICFVPAAKMVRTLNGRVPGPGWKRYFAFRNQLVICRCYGENALVAHVIAFDGVF